MERLGTNVICPIKAEPSIIFQLIAMINTKANRLSLLETETLPSAKFFAECQKSGTRQRIALGKDFFAECRQLGKHGHSAKDFFAEC